MSQQPRHPMPLRQAISSAIARTRRGIRRRVAISWSFTYRLKHKLDHLWQRFASILLLALLVLSVSTSIYLAPSLQTFLEAQYNADNLTHELRGLLLNLGSALIGASVIVTSLVLFAIQVNVERMPHGLF